MKTYDTIRGMRDFLPEDLAKRRLIEKKVRNCFRLYGYEEIETPIIESFDLITAKVGDEIRHRMYAFKDHGGRKVAMRPEMTASVARLVSKKLRSKIKPLRLGYIANCFRYDNPQSGRYREFWQAGFELLGSDRNEADAEMIIVFNDLMKSFGFQNFTIKIGNVGIIRELLNAEAIEEKDQNLIMGLLDKRRVTKALNLLNEKRVSEECKSIFKRLLALKGSEWTTITKKGKEILNDYSMALNAVKSLEEIVRLSQEGGVTSNILIDLGFSRGLEYYTGMIFEVFVPNLKIALGGGGRYDKLVELFGGEPTPAVGCSPGIDRIVLAMEKEEMFRKKETSPVEVLIVPIDKVLVGETLKIATILRSEKVSAQVEISGRKLGSALSHADKIRVPIVIIVGSREMDEGFVIIRNMRSKMQRAIPVTSVIKEIKKELGCF